MTCFVNILPNGEPRYRRTIPSQASVRRVLRAAKHPTLQFDDDVLYVDQGQILTSAGSAAGLDLSLHVVRRDYGPDVANQVARRLVLPAHRNGGQRQYVERPVPEREGARLSDLLAKVRASPDQSFTVAEMARMAAMSKRTLHRRFLEPPRRS